MDLPLLSAHPPRAVTAITAGNRGLFYLFLIGGRERPGRERQESIMGVIEIILIGFIGVNTVLGLSSLVTVGR
ncbi:MAG: hypothetical protein CMI63_13010 [Parvularcula sp.]|uniref:hypothetical protein n=1 Tax=Hyphococcus sp. TaxID=2038636 RepID=UPI000C5C36F2|nr:hypothetical protein [Parvularcula sp.]